MTLDQTAFYPEGGGQACDLGTLGGVRVLDVKEKGEAVVHLCDGPLLPGSTVEGQIDWTRRFDLMQQHTGEHIVSGIIHEMFGGHNTGFHVGRPVLLLDIPLQMQQVALQKMDIVRQCGGEGGGFGAKARLPEADRDEAGCCSVVDLVE